MIVFSLRDLFIWANIFCVSFLSFSWVYVLTYLTDRSSSQKGIKPGMDHFSSIFRVGLCWNKPALIQIYSLNTQSVCVAHVCVHVRGGRDSACTMRNEDISVCSDLHPKEGSKCLWYPTQDVSTAGH